MAKLPKVTLRRGRDGHQVKVNAFEYSLSIARWLAKGYKIVGESRGDATDAQIRTALAEAEAEETRRRNPNSPAFHDPQRRYEQRAGHANIVTEGAEAVRAIGDDRQTATERLAADQDAIASEPMPAEPSRRGPGRPRKNP